MRLIPAALLAISCPALSHPLSGPPPSQTALNVKPQVRFTERLRDAFTWLRPTDWFAESSKPTHTYPSRADPATPTKVLREHYDEDLVLRFNISSEHEAKSLAEAADTLFLDLWDFTTEWADIRLAKDVVHSLLGLLPKSMQHAHAPLIHNLAQAVYDSLPSSHQQQEPMIRPSSLESPRTLSATLHQTPSETNVFFKDFQPLSAIVPWMNLMSSLFPTHVRLINIGQSYEGRDILGLRVGVHPRNAEKPSRPRKTIVVSGGIHAREWISVSSTTYAAYSMITSYGKNRELTKLMEEFDWIFIPTLNPDGYVYTWENDRLWRKNTQETNLRFCKGLDLDRTFGFEWDGERTKGNPCSESFAGEEPFEAVESSRFADWVKSENATNEVEFIGFLDLHSYSQQILYPYSYSCISTPPTLENLEEVGLGLSKAIHHASGEYYGVTSACEGNVAGNPKTRTSQISWPRLESSGGTALDWMYHEMSVRYSYQIKLRDTGSYGFLLPKENIVPTGDEVFRGLKFLGNYLLSNKGVEEGEQSPSSETREIEFHKTSGSS